MNKAEVDHKIIHVITLQPISWLYFFFPIAFYLTSAFNSIPQFIGYLWSSLAE